MRIEELFYPISETEVDEKNFDLEKWREEKPMDYFKALFVLNKAEGIIKDYIFKEIYKATRLYIPEVLYKYFALTENEEKLKTLEQGKIYMSDIKDFNDPFDSKGYYYNAEELKKYPWLLPYAGKIIDDFSVYIKATSLTSNGINSMPMWAHYTNNHRGFCVSYDMKVNTALSACTFPVQYTQERLDITDFMDKYICMMEGEKKKQLAKGNKKIIIRDLSLIYYLLLLGNIKHSSWSYEKEFRCASGATAEDMPYIAAKPKEIYVGINCSKEHYERLFKIAELLCIPIHQMKFDECSPDYKLVVKD